MGKTIIPCAVLLFCLCGNPSLAGQSRQDLGKVHSRLASQVRHELVMLPRYTLFDNLQFEITDVDTVILSGEVVRPTLKSDAESVVRNLEGVGKVINKIEVLPLSPSDDRIRLAAYRAIFSKAGMERYAVQAVPPIHIIVRNGSITLTGIVATQMDKDLAGIAAREVPGAFGVTNNLRVEK
jgi:hyperosmotically inducible protein